MALSYLTDIDLNKNELQNAVIQKVGTDPSSGLTEGYIIYNTAAHQLKVYSEKQISGSDEGWINVGGDITAVNITAGTGLTGTVSTSSGVHTQTLTLADTSTDLTATNSGSYGSATAIPTFTVDRQGRLTAAGTVAISTDLTISADSGSNDVVSVGTDTLTFAGTTNEIDTAVTNNQIQIGLVANPTISGNLIVSGNLTVSGTTTTVNTETINLADNIITLNSNETGTPSENAGIEVERGTATNVALRWNETSDIWELTKDGTNYKTIQNVQESTYSEAIGDGSATAINVDHDLNSLDVIVQLYDTSSGDTVYADVVRTSVNRVTVTFSSAPSTGDIKVLVSKIG